MSPVMFPSGHLTIFKWLTLILVTYANDDDKYLKHYGDEQL